MCEELRSEALGLTTGTSESIAEHVCLLLPVPQVLQEQRKKISATLSHLLKEASQDINLAVVLDAFSRRVIGWALDRTLEAKLTVAALEMALSRRSVKAGLVHHSDRGVQYAAADYTGLLDQHGIQISMSRKGNPYDNARTESFMKTLKYEEVYRQEYRDLSDALRSLRRFIEKVYNEKRLHSALGYLPPSEFEANLVLTNNRTEAASRQLSL